MDLCLPSRSFASQRSIGRPTGQSSQSPPPPPSQEARLSSCYACMCECTHRAVTALPRPKASKALAKRSASSRMASSLLSGIGFLAARWPAVLGRGGLAGGLEEAGEAAAGSKERSPTLLGERKPQQPPAQAPTSQNARRPGRGPPAFDACGLIGGLRFGWLIGVGAGQAEG